MRPRRIRIHSAISWALALFSLTTIATGYALSRHWVPDVYTMSFIHRLSELGFIAFLILHIGMTLYYYQLNWGRLIDGLKNRSGTQIHLLRLVQRVSSWLIVVFALFVILSGFNGYELLAPVVGGIAPFEWHRFYDLFLVSMIGIHVAVGLKFVAIRKRLKGPIINLGVLVLLTSLMLGAIFLEVPPLPRIVNDPHPPGNNPGPTNTTNQVYVPLKPPSTVGDATTVINGVSYAFNTTSVQTKRNDIFRPGQFSAFDVLAHLNDSHFIYLEYHFNTSYNTYVIDSLNDHEFWWYEVVYSGGWSESNVYRMDHYHWKPGTLLTFFQVSERHLNRIYDTFAEEVERIEANDGAVIIPEVTIHGNSFSVSFEDVTVTAHNLRDDVLQDGVITAIDVIMSLGDQGLITYELGWFDSIGTAEVVRSYWVQMINGDYAVGTCGFVYEEGDLDFRGFSGNHIHLPSDVRIINSPEYELWFWICL